MRNPISGWLTRHHGEGAEHQSQFYRCLACHSVVTWRHILEGGCKCGGSRMSPTNPLFLEKCRLLFLPWTV